MKIVKFNILSLCVLFLGLCMFFSFKNKDDNSTKDVENVDKSYSPGDDFYAYVNSNWMKNHPLPADKSRYGWFNVLDDQNKEKIKSIIETASQQKDNAIAQKIGDFFQSGMDTSNFVKRFASLQTVVEKIQNIKTKNDLATILGYLSTVELNPLFELYAAADDKNSEMNIACIYQNLQGMPDRDYYLGKDSIMVVNQKAYIAYVENLIKLYNADSKYKITSSANTFFDFEKEIANASFTRLQNRNIQLTYNKMPYSLIVSKYKSFNWNAYFQGANIVAPKEININQPSFIEFICNLTENKQLSFWKDYLTFAALNSVSSELGQKYEDASFNFYGKVLQGKEAKEPRWKLVQREVSDKMGEAIGKLYVEKYFPAEAKLQMTELIENLRTSFRNRILKNDWMDEATKTAAIDKLSAIRVKVGYPDKWRDYTGLVINKGSYLNNILNANAFEFKYMASKIDKPVDKTLWDMSPQTVNAYYNPSGNEIVFPAAILQPPFFYLNGDAALNYGAIGMVIGHEMTHGFDDQGALYDKFGNLKNWWSKDDSVRFAQKTKILAEQYSQFIVKDTLHANGYLTLGENLADLGGVNIAFDAYKIALKGKNVEDKDVNGFSADQRFFLSYANVWAQNIREQEMIRLTKVDVHSLGKYRINGPLPNLEVFYKAFNVTKDNKLFIAPEKRAIIW
jgi:putative endopeptidase